MTLHLIKLCVGAASIEDLAHWQAGRIAALKRSGADPRLFHTTRMRPKRQDDLIDGGSLYWVIKGVVLVRQGILGFGDGNKPDGTPCCLVYLDPELVPVRPVPKRAFQGWRYLHPDEAPPDLTSCTSGDAIAAMPAGMRRALAELGLI
jgi:hypothetical protein